MRGSHFVFAALLAVSPTRIAGAGTGPIDRPTPCPCCADGACYPKRESWGYYGTRWRRWPGDFRPDIPGPDEPEVEGQMPPELETVERPRPEEEDAAAPPSAAPETDAPTAVDEGPPVGLPPLDGVEQPQGPAPQPQQGGPVTPPPRLPGPLQPEPPPGLDVDPPPTLPFGPPPNAPPLNVPEPKSETPAPFQLPLRSPGDPRRFDHDLPPALPAGLSWQQQRQPATTSRWPERENAFTRLPQVAGRGRSSRIDARVKPAAAAIPASADRREIVGRAVFTAPTAK